MCVCGGGGGGDTGFLGRELGGSDLQRRDLICEFYLIYLLGPSKNWLSLTEIQSYVVEDLF